MKHQIKKIVYIVLVLILLSLLAGGLAACNSGHWIYVTYYYNNELLEQEKYWEYNWSMHGSINGDAHEDDLVWDKDSDNVMTTVKRLCNKLYSERGKKVFFAAKDFLDGKYTQTHHLYIHSVYSYTYGECKFNLSTNSLETNSKWIVSLDLLYTETKNNYILVARDEP